MWPEYRAHPVRACFFIFEKEDTKLGREIEGCTVVLLVFIIRVSMHTAKPDLAISQLISFLTRDISHFADFFGNSCVPP